MRRMPYSYVVRRVIGLFLLYTPRRLCWYANPSRKILTVTRLLFLLDTANEGRCVTRGKWQKEDEKDRQSRRCSLRLSEHAESRGETKKTKLSLLAFPVKICATHVYLIFLICDVIYCIYNCRIGTNNSSLQRCPSYLFTRDTVSDIGMVISAYIFTRK